jgi:four helix bundle protein
MATFKTLEEIRVWGKARLLVREIYSISDRGLFARDFGLRDQIRRASVSIASNIAEGFERDGNAEFIQFLSLAKGSAGEVKTQLHIAFDVGFIDIATLHRLQENIDQICRMIGCLMDYLRQSEAKGRKFVRPNFDPKRGTRNPKRR